MEASVELIRIRGIGYLEGKTNDDSDDTMECMIDSDDVVNDLFRWRSNDDDMKLKTTNGSCAWHFFAHETR